MDRDDERLWRGPTQGHDDTSFGDRQRLRSERAVRPRRVVELEPVQDHDAGFEHGVEQFAGGLPPFRIR